ncbi:N-terminal glutamine amidase-domain-containing protein [Sporodiniella umbellata]|nr:N-terminal glutamine amidase-domain-containing protein [Sporodiniella umbellata]
MIIKRDDCIYTKQYCEENIYMMCRMINDEYPDEIYQFNVVFIINPDKKIPIWKQKAGTGDDPVVWDYHVIMLYNEGNDDLSVYDFDTVLPFPCDAQEYIKESFKPQYRLRDEYERFFRVIPAHVYLENFSSDRSHMKRKDGTYIAKPPIYAPIVSKCEIDTFLDDFLTLEYDPYNPHEFGKVLNSSNFYEMANLVYDHTSQEDSREVQRVRQRLSKRALYYGGEE